MAIKKLKGSKYKLSPKIQRECHKIIHTASVATAAAAAGLAQLPLADNTVITPIQITMIVSLGKVFDLNVSKAFAKSLLTGFILNFVGRGVSQAIWGWIPIVGNTSNAITATAVTESIGWLSVDFFYKEKNLKQKDFELKEMVTLTEDMNSDVTKSQKDEIDKERIKDLAEKFLNGEKNKNDNQKELIMLIKEINSYLSSFDDSELFGYLSKLMDLM